MPIDGLTVTDVNQEHGLIAARDAAASAAMFDVLPIGARVRILPNHACMTAAYESYWVDGGAALRRWPRCNGW